MEIIQFQSGISNSFIIRGRKNILFDCGCDDGAESFKAACEDNDIGFGDISLIIIGHGHVDHYANARIIKELTGAPLMCHALAEKTLREGGRPTMVPRNELGRRIWQDTQENDPVPYVSSVIPDIVVEGEVSLKPYGIDGKLIETPGHSPCSMTLLLDSGTAFTSAFVGDILLASPLDNSLCAAWFADDNQVLFSSIEKVLGIADIIYSGHGGPYTISEAEAVLKAEKEKPL